VAPVRELLTVTYRPACRCFTTEEPCPSASVVPIRRLWQSAERERVGEALERLVKQVGW
jgi:hypothetical protein